MEVSPDAETEGACWFRIHSCIILEHEQKSKCMVVSVVWLDDDVPAPGGVEH